jgi:hypothetical protein
LLLLPLPLSVGVVGFDGCSCEGEGGLFDKGGPGSGGVPILPQFLIVGSHGDKGVAVVPLFVEDFDDGPVLELVVLNTLFCVVDVVTG